MDDNTPGIFIFPAGKEIPCRVLVSWLSQSTRKTGLRGVQVSHTRTLDLGSLRLIQSIRPISAHAEQKTGGQLRVRYIQRETGKEFR